MKQVKYFDVYTNGKTKRYYVDSTKEYECYVRLLKYANKDTVVTHIVYDDDTHEYIDIPIYIKTRQATEKALEDFRVLSNYDKYKECALYGKDISKFNTYTTVGWLAIRIIEIYGRKFLFTLVARQVINCYELQ